LPEFHASWPVAVAILLASLWVINWASDKTVDGLLGISKHYKISQLFAGAFIAAVGSSLPELFGSISSVTLEHAELGMGAIMGSAVFNIVVIIGIAALVSNKPLTVRAVVLWRDLGFYVITLLVTIFFFYNDVWYGEGSARVAIWEMYVWMAMYVGYFIFLLRDLRASDEEQAEAQAAADEDEDHKDLSVGQSWGAMFLGLAGITVAAHFMMSSTLAIADSLPFMDATVLALIVLAAGTSIPDLLVSLKAAQRGAGDLAVANAVGSNTFDILIGLGLPWAVRAAIITPNAAEGVHTYVAMDPVVGATMPMVIGSTILAFIVLRSGYQVTKREGWVLLASYVGFIGWVLWGWLG